MRWIRQTNQEGLTDAGVIGSEVSEDQFRVMERSVHEAMEAGALRLSTGLEFEPGRSATTDEIVRLAAVAGRHGGYYASHIRNRDARVQDAINEFLWRRPSAR